MSRILISGANQGLGFYLVEYLLQFPNNQIFLGSRSVDKGEEAAKKLRSNPENHETSQVKVVQLDVTDDESVKKAAALDDLKTLDILVNNAGVYCKLSAEKRVTDFSESTRLISLPPYLLCLSSLQSQSLTNPTKKISWSKPTKSTFLVSLLSLRLSFQL